MHHFTARQAYAAQRARAARGDPATKNPHAGIWQLGSLAPDDRSIDGWPEPPWDEQWPA